MTFGGANSVIRLAIARPSASPRLVEDPRDRALPPWAIGTAWSMAARPARILSWVSRATLAAAARIAVASRRARRGASGLGPRCAANETSPRSGLSAVGSAKQLTRVTMPSPRYARRETTRKSSRPGHSPNQCSARVIGLASLSIIDRRHCSRLKLWPNGRSRSSKSGLVAAHARARVRRRPAAPRQTPLIALDRSGPASAMHRGRHPRPGRGSPARAGGRP